MQFLLLGTLFSNIEMKIDKIYKKCDSSEQVVNTTTIANPPDMLIISTVRWCYHISCILIKTAIK